jgi:hypothetical protein
MRGNFSAKPVTNYFVQSSTRPTLSLRQSPSMPPIRNGGGRHVAKIVDLRPEQQSFPNCRTILATVESKYGLEAAILCACHMFGSTRQRGS